MSFSLSSSFHSLGKPSRATAQNLFCLLFLALVLTWPSGTLARQPLKRTPEKGYQAAFKAMDKGQTGPVEQELARGRDPILNKILKAYLMAQPGNTFSFDDMTLFITENPEWPGIKGILMIAEQKIPQGASNTKIINWFNAYPPKTAAGFYRYIEALEASGHGRIAETFIRNRWIEADFSQSDLATYQARFDSLLTREDHFARIDRLLWKGNEGAVRAMFPFVDNDVRALSEARLALAGDKGNVAALIEKVPRSLQDDSGLLYERLRWRRTRGDDAGAIEILAKTPENVVKPERWWQERHVIIRRLMENKDFTQAYRLASRHGLSTGFSLAQAEFLSGWLALRFLNRPDLAEHHFKQLIEKTNMPVSQARGFYWLGRAYEALEKKHEAEQAYESAAALDTTFYGQMAITRIYAEPIIRAIPEPPIPAAVHDSFFRRDLIRAITALYNRKQLSRAETFFRAALNAATQRVEFALLLELAHKLHRPDWAVIAAKEANQKNFIVRDAGYPILNLKLPTPPEPAFTHALIRQESQFQTDAQSPVGANGLMQLMPATAKHVAKKLGLRHDSKKMCDPQYNTKLGTYFIQKQIDDFGGSYILALAGYNAGPGRVREWMSLFGDPRTGQIDPIDWIELIPIYETRNYVQRIIENLQFYRARLSRAPVRLRILDDLRR